MVCWREKGRRVGVGELEWRGRGEVVTSKKKTWSIGRSEKNIKKIYGLPENFFNISHPLPTAD